MKSKFVYVIDTDSDIQMISHKVYRDTRNNLLKSIDFRTRVIKSLNEETVIAVSYTSNLFYVHLYKILKSSIKE